jgi:hypothetical protein
MRFVAHHRAAPDVTMEFLERRRLLDGALDPAWACGVIVFLKPVDNVPNRIGRRRRLVSQLTPASCGGPRPARGCNSRHLQGLSGVCPLFRRKISTYERRPE